MSSRHQGFEVIFIAPQSRRHGHRTAIDAVVATAESMGITRVTRRDDALGSGFDGHVHSAHFFELADQPVELMYVLEGDRAEQLIDAVDQAGIEVFFLRRAVEYGQLGRADEG
ncbi:DUF190 domain-containing protein [Kushneria phosphatilytica]|uniref:DUF190 domain-containing protein n=1 Tax=Kushneria phosphatilytica TaxID=657387 RepID=A0A1S1NS14_9GAMM|nr:DUF190 domain-containing protein [Kushneria phosphatilytica]OHV07710.1 hypothetical protein BH688_16105 [Kushneria phosphatilytica]QEL10207.1 DUF190 domain-containing protein [Kushneria phosphatilytica]